VIDSAGHDPVVDLLTRAIGAGLFFRQTGSHRMPNRNGATSMKVHLLAWGSRGDVQPFVALALSLKAQGHEPVVVAGRDFESFVTRHRVAFEAFDIDISETIQSREGQRWLAGSQRLTGELRAIHAVAKLFAEPAVDKLVQLADNTDHLISGVLTMDAAMSIAQSRGIGHDVGALAPFIPTRSGAAQVFPLLPSRQSPLNRVFSSVMMAGTFGVFRSIGDEVRRRLDLPAVGYRQFHRLAAETHQWIGASPILVPPAPDWPPGAQATGQWVLPLAEDYVPNDEATHFLDEGETPVHLGFGSMPSRHPGQLFELYARSLADVGLRGIIQGNWNGWRPTEIPENVLLVDDIPHEWLFSRVQASVHHGGAGTTGTALRAGLGQVVVPHMGDQPYFARRVRELGIGGSVPQHRLTHPRLTALLRLATSTECRDKALTLAALATEEPGASAVHLTAR